MLAGFGTHKLSVLAAYALRRNLLAWLETYKEKYEKALADKVDNFQILRPDGRLENLVCLAPGVRVRACASCAAEPGATRTSVDIDQVLLELGPLKLPLPIKTDGRGFVEWSYLDEDFRITQVSEHAVRGGG